MTGSELAVPSGCFRACVHVSYHAQPVQLMQALIARYKRGEREAMRPLLTERVSKEDKARCSGPRDFSTSSKADALVHFMQTHGPWAWSGMAPLHFKPGGVLQTPWGQGRWGPLDEENLLFADFVGNKHNLQFELPEMGRFVSRRCGDAEPVIGKLATGIE